MSHFISFFHQGYFLILKCTSQALQDCEHFMKVNLKNMCAKFVEKNQFWTEVYASLKPRFKCPIKKVNKPSLAATLLLKGLEV